MKYRYGLKLLTIGGTPKEHIVLNIGVYVIFIFLCVVLLVFVNNVTKPVLFELEGNCNTGFVGVDFSERFVFDESSKTKGLINYNPQKFDVKNIDGMNCNLKIKGEISPFFYLYLK